MSWTKEACLELVGQLRGAGFHSVSIDPEELSPDPVCLWVQPRGIGAFTLAGGATLSVWLYAITGNVDTAHAMELLDDALAGVLALELTLSDTDQPVDLAAAVVLPHQSQALPAYRLALDLDL
jgi:hypothetical protein